MAIASAMMTKVFVNVGNNVNGDLACRFWAEQVSSIHGHKHERLYRNTSASLDSSSRRTSRLWFAKSISISFRAIGQSPDMDKDRDITR